MEIINRPRAEDVRQNAKHVLFVEGESDSIDKVSITELLRHDTVIEVEQMGRSDYVSSAARALASHHPNYYFLADRDAEDDGRVEGSWANFPNLETHNLLLWRRKELENYFIDPDFVCHSNFFKATREELIDCLEKEAARRVFLDAANYVVIKIRDLCRANWISIHKETELYKNRDEAINQLVSRTEFASKLEAEQNRFSSDNLVNMFEMRLHEMLDGQDKCVFGHGRWLQLISGKKIMKSLFSLSMFEVKDRSGGALQGIVKEKEIAKSLMRLDETKLPSDFVQLKSIIKQRIQT